MSKRDEWSCPCCGVPNDSSYCDACLAFECGERDYDDPNIETCLVPKGVEVKRGYHAAHYAYGDARRGHDLLIVETTGAERLRPAGLPGGFDYHSGSRIGGVQTWRFTRRVTLSAGKCERCSS